MLYEPCHMLPKALVVVAFKPRLLGEPAYCSLDIIHPFQRSATIIRDAVYLNILTAELNEVAPSNGSPLYRCHGYMKNIITSCIITTLRNIHTGYTVAYATDGLSPSIVSLA